MFFVPREICVPKTDNVNTDIAQSQRYNGLTQSTLQLTLSNISAAFSQLKLHCVENGSNRDGF